MVFNMTMIFRSTLLLCFSLAVAQKNVEKYCPNEADALSDCALNAGHTTQLITSCTSCVTDLSLPEQGSGLDCSTFSQVFCTNIDDKCDPTCDDGACQTAFREFFHCMAQGTFTNEVSTTGEVCNIDCEGGIDGTGDIGGLDDIEVADNGDSDGEKEDVDEEGDVEGDEEGDSTTTPGGGGDSSSAVDGGEDSTSGGKTMLTSWIGPLTVIVMPAVATMIC